MITIMGATGRTGGQITKALLEAGETLRALGRSAQRLAGLAAAGAEVMAGEAADAGFLTEAFRGADAVYALMPYDPGVADFEAQQHRQGVAIATAVRDSGVRHVVFLSSVGADLAQGIGPIACLHHQEQRLRAIAGVNLLFLRAGAFYENFAEAMPTIREQGVVADAYAPDVAVPMVATRDIALAASLALRRRDWEGVVVREVLGPCDLSYAQATRIIGEQIGLPALPYVRVEYEAWVDLLVQAGLSDSVARTITELARAINEGRVKSQSAGGAGRMSTRFEDFAEELVDGARVA